YQGRDLLQLSERELQREIRGNQIAMIFQDPGASLNPVFTIQNQLEESFKMYQQARKSEYRDLVISELKKVKLPDVEKLLGQYPHQLSGGMKQRVMISMMLACNPRLLIADEPTTALDVSIQAQFIQVLRDLKQEFQITVFYITHDLAVVSEVCDYVSVMYAGRIVENTPVDQLFKNPIHPYTYKLVHSVLGVETSLEQLEEIPGSVPGLINPPAGCRFNPRCQEVREICHQKKPAIKQLTPDHSVACHRR
ncbi:MAG: ABC transporter ATP-binding protein, partial [Bacillota bacterium]